MSKPKGWNYCRFLWREVIDSGSGRSIWICLRLPCMDKKLGYKVCDESYCPKFGGLISEVVDAGITRIVVRE